MANSKDAQSSLAADEASAHLDMPPERRVAAKAQAAMLSRTADRVARELPFGTDVDDFRRALIQGAQASLGNKS